MDDRQEMSGNDREIEAEVEQGMGVPQQDADETPVVHEAQEPEVHEGKNDPLYVQKRLKQQKRSHEREMREMQARIEQLQSKISPNQAQPMQQGPYGPNGEGQGNVNDVIQQAVSYALQQKEMEERKAKESQAQQHIVKQYQDLNRHLDSTADKYDDFDDVVRGDAPFTATMRDIALTLPKKGAGSAGEVLYRLGKNPDELSRIAKLHPVDQAAEIIALSHALISGGDQKQSPSRPLGQIKSNPVVNSVGVNEKTPVSDIRSRMKEGKFK
jgi:hypothetical protein